MWSHEYYHANRTPPGFPHIRTLPGATLWSDLEIWKDTKSNASNGPDKVIIPTKMMIDRSPTLLCSQGVKDLCVNSEYEKFAVLKEKIKEDVEGVNKLIRDRGVNAFRVIETLDKQRYYVAYDATASVWIYPKPNYSQTNSNSEANNENDETESVTSYTSVFQLGKYSSATDVAGTVDFKFEHSESEDISRFLASKIVEVMQSAFEADIHTDIILQFLVDQQIVYEADEINWNGKIEKFGETGCLSTYAAMTVMQVLCCIFYWTFKKYSIKLGIFNWCRDNSLWVSECALYNADMVQVERDVDNHTKIKIPKAPKSTPPMFEPLIPFGASCHYVIVFFANDFNFFEGCGFALRMQIDRRQTDKGFFYAFDCKRFKNNRQKAREISKFEGGLRQFYDTPKWDSNPLKFIFKVENIPVAITLNALNCSRDRYYPIINFGYKSQ